MLKIFIVPLLLLLQGCAGLTQQSDQQPVEKQAKVVTTEGQAVIQKGALIEARVQAIQVAIRKAVSLGGVEQNPSHLVANTKVVDEWQENGRYHVQIVTVISNDAFCQPPYKKRIVATAFPLVTTGQISGNESQDLYSGIPREIMNQLMESGDFIGRNQTRTVLYSRPDLAPEIVSDSDYGDSTILDLARQNNSQFVLSGVIRDFEVESTEYVRGAGILAQIKSAVRDVVARRGITIDIYVHDGLSGSLLFQHRYSDSILGDVWIPSGYAVGSERFKATPAGQKISQIIQSASDDIRRVFGCYPFTARVVKIENNQVVIAAGAQDKLKPGDTLVVYAGSRLMQGLGQPGSQKEPIGLLKLESINAMFASGRMEIPIKIRKVKAGDWVKSW